MTQLLREYPSAAMLALLGVIVLAAYLVARGRRLGPMDLLAFAVMAAVSGFLAVVVHGMWEPGSPFNLFVLVGLIFIVPVAVFSMLGLGLVAIRVLHIALTGGREGPASPADDEEREPANRPR